MKNIAIISPSLNNGGAERIAGLLSKELSKIYNVYLFLLDTENIVYEYGGTIVNIGNSGPFFEYAIKINKEKYKIDVAVSFLEMMNFANIRTRVNERIIISERCTQSYIEPKAYGEEMQIRRYYDYADEMVACSLGVEYEMRTVYELTLPITPIYNFINQDAVRLKAREDIDCAMKDFLGNSEYFVNIGRLHNQKNQERLIRQFKVFHEQDESGIKLLIVGSGELHERLCSLISELDLEDYIRVIDYKNNPFKYMARAKALILSSKYEGLPNVLLEAMTLGCPIIAVDCMSGPRELLDDDLQYGVECENVRVCKRGILVANRDSENDCATTFLAEAMKKASDRNLCNDMADQEVEYMRQYNNRIILKQWVEVIERSYRQEICPTDAEMERLRSAKNIYIYGAGLVGRSYYIRLSKEYKINGFIVSQNDNGMNELYEAPIYEADTIRNMQDSMAVIVGVSYQYQNDIVKKMKEQNIENIVFPWIEPLAYDYYVNCKKYDLKCELVDWSRLYLKRNFDIDHPVGFNEKIQWLKLYDSTELKTRLADKVLVRDYIRGKIGEKYLIPCLGVWDSFDEIDWDMLPDRFVLKCNHGSGTNAIIKSKKDIDYDKLKRKFDNWMQMNYAFVSGFEMHYADIPRKIIAEEFIGSEGEEDIKDYKLMCFNGRVKCSFVCSERNTNGLKVTFFDREWKKMPFERHYPMSKEEIAKPHNYEEMVTLSEVLAVPFTFVRVDFYEVNNKVYFGELTFCPGTGVEEFTPAEWDVLLGDMLAL